VLVWFEPLRLAVEKRTGVKLKEKFLVEMENYEFFQPKDESLFAQINVRQS
jgi:hypothetical protein